MQLTKLLEKLFGITPQENQIYSTTLLKFNYCLLFAKNPLVLPEIELEVLQLSALYHNAGTQAMPLRSIHKASK